MLFHQSDVALGLIFFGTFTDIDGESTIVARVTLLPPPKKMKSMTKKNLGELIELMGNE